MNEKRYRNGERIHEPEVYGSVFPVQNFLPWYRRWEVGTGIKVSERLKGKEDYSE